MPGRDSSHLFFQMSVRSSLEIWATLEASIHPMYLLSGVDLFFQMSICSNLESWATMEAPIHPMYLLSGVAVSFTSVF